MDGPRTRDDGIQVLRRAAAALDEIATAPGRLRLVDLHTRLGLAKSTTRRLLVGLVEVGFEPSTMTAGSSSATDCSVWSASTPPTWRRPSGATLERVAEATGETADLSLFRAGQMLFIDQIESPHRLRAVSAVGARFPLYDNANGKATLAVLDDADVASVLAPLGPDLAASLRSEIDEIRSTGVAFDRDEHTDGISAAGIAARAAGGNIVAISVPAPTERFLTHQDRIVGGAPGRAGVPGLVDLTQGCTQVRARSRVTE